MVRINYRTSLGLNVSDYTPRLLAGSRRPGQISVTGFNDMPFLELIRPKLTTVRVKQHEAGRLAADILLHLMDSARSDAVPIETALPVELVVRDSSAVACKTVHPHRRTV